MRPWQDTSPPSACEALSPVPGTQDILHTRQHLHSLKGPNPQQRNRGGAGMAEPISQAGNEKQEQTAGNFSTSWKLASRLCGGAASTLSLLNTDHASACHRSEVTGTAVFLSNASCLLRGKRQAWGHAQQEDRCQRPARKSSSRCSSEPRKEQCTGSLEPSLSGSAFPSLGPRLCVGQMTE